MSEGELLQLGADELSRGLLGNLLIAFGALSAAIGTGLAVFGAYLVRKRRING